MTEGQRLTTTEVLLVVLGFLGLTALYWWPMLMDPDQVWAVGRDFFQNTWNLWWVDTAYESNQAYYETDRLFAPTGTSLAFHTISFANSMPGLLLQQSLGLSLGLTHTVLFLSAFVLSGIGGWALVRYLTGAPIAAFAAGVFFTFNPYHTMMITQLNNVQFQWMPLVLLGLMLMYDRKGWWSVAFTAVMLALAGYTDWYQPIFCAMAGGVLLLVRMLKDKRVRDGKLWTRITVMGGLAGVMMAPGAMPLFEAMGAAGGSGELEEPVRYVGETQLLGMSPNGMRAHFFWPVVVGWSTCLIALYTMFRVRAEGVGRFWWLFGIGFLLLQGPYLVILNQHLDYIPMPMAIFQHIPVLDMIRVPHRFLILMILGLTGLIGYGLREFQIQRGKFATFLIIPIMALELQPPQPKPVALREAPVYSLMASDPADYAVLELPIDYRDGYTMWLQTIHGKKLLAGYTSHILPDALPALQTDLMRALHPSVSNTDVLGLPEHLAVNLEELTEGQLEEWRRELVIDKDVRFAVLHRRADFSASSAGLNPPATSVQKLKFAFMPYRFNPGVQMAPQLRKVAANKFFEDLAANSTQARALMVLMFGEPVLELGTTAAEVWDLRPWTDRYAAENKAE
ncbi:MAG: hypothetical protein GY747_09320 [Planctomycetes bacterium]|nr:hypothetical protein [Planctomycetota bacterium]MCP4770467.1 hypothetical protein [Planctomycetota bacterium]MCP4859907.1 hypothetical protein [Planctomycetota bacterium]